MSKILFIIRHAKSSWKNAHLLPDFDRPLNKRGKAAAPEMANRMVAKGLKPQLIVSSPAKRAFSTAKYFANAWGICKNDIRLEPELYDASVPALLKMISNFDNRFDSIAIFGHSPECTNFTNELCNSHIQMPTTGIAIISLPIDDWKQVEKGSGKLVLFDYPKNVINNTD